MTATLPRRAADVDAIVVAEAVSRVCGPIRVAATADGLCATAFLAWSDRLEHRLAGTRAERGANRHTDRFLAELERWDAGRLARFTVPVDLRGVPAFIGAVLRALREVPAGTVLSYGELAARAGSPRAARAVGQAMRRNPLPLVIPCHRVIASGGRIGGFTPGLEPKRVLLAHEGVDIA